MSKLTDYSKFDQIDTESEEEEEKIVNLCPTDAKMIHDDLTGRYFFLYKNARVYEWEQKLSEVIVYIAAPPIQNLSKDSIDCQITPNHVKLGLRGQNPFIDEQTAETVEAGKSLWCIEEVETTTSDSPQKLQEIKMIVIYLHKANKAKVWENVFVGKFPGISLDPFQVENEKRALLLERYGEEHGAGFDFRDAKITGSVPDPRTFMGGVSHD
jgi:hypothetical protein